MGYRSLRVINEDVVAPRKGFGTHPHRNMEILSYVISGSLEHKDSLGNGRVIQSGEFQYMSAGEGVLHSEFNPSSTEPAHFLQIWIVPEAKGGEPRYQDFDTKALTRNDGLVRLASPDGQEGTAAIRQQAEVYFGQLERDQTRDITVSSAYPYLWLQIISGDMRIGDTTLTAGDGAAIEAGNATLMATQASTFLLFRLQ